MARRWGIVMTEGHRNAVETLAASHSNLQEVVAAAGPPSDPSYCSEWTIAQVLSHLGSGAEIGLLNLNAALAGEPPPDRERYVEIWDVWNAKTPEAMAADSLVADAAYVDKWQSIDDAALDALRVPMMGRELDASGYLAMRLFEHSVHTWDIAVMSDPAAGVFPAATELLVGRVPDRIGRAAHGAKPASAPVRLEVTTVAPAEHFALAIEPEAVAIDDGSAPDGKVAIPGEALLRLISGRLDPAHTPADVSVEGAVSLDELRTLFDQS
jgi:uncharacterized protein (TIGR03083 family)